MLDNLFPVLRAIKLLRTSANLTNSTSPLVIAKNITLAIVDCCTPPPVRLVAHCFSVAALCDMSQPYYCRREYTYAG